MFGHRLKLVVVLLLFLNLGIIQVVNGSTTLRSVHLVRDYDNNENILDSNEKNTGDDLDELRSLFLHSSATTDNAYQNVQSKSVDKYRKINVGQLKSAEPKKPSFNMNNNADMMGMVNNNNNNKKNNNDTFKSLSIIRDNNNEDMENDSSDFYDEDNYNYDDDDYIYNYNEDLTANKMAKSKLSSKKDKDKLNTNLNLKHPKEDTTAQDTFKLKPIKEDDNNNISRKEDPNDCNKEDNKIVTGTKTDIDTATGTLTDTLTGIIADHKIANNNNNNNNEKLKDDWNNYDNDEDTDGDDDEDEDDEDEDEDEDEDFDGDTDTDTNTDSDSDSDNDINDDDDEDNDTDDEDIINGDINDEEDIVFSQSIVCPRYCTCERNINNYLVAYCNRIDPHTQKFGKDITDLVVTDVNPKYPIILEPKFFYKLGLKYVSTIKMANCSIEYLHVKAFHGLDDLYSVNLTNVGLTIMNPTIFTTNKKLRLLTISGNDLSVMSSVPYLIQSSSLEELDLSHNNLMELSVQAFTQLKNIIYINLSQNNLQQLPSNVFEKLNTLEELDLSYNSLKFLPSDLFTRTSLAILHLKYNSITDDLSFGTQNLQQLDLSFNQIHQIHQGMFENMTGLTTLYLKGNGLTRIQTNSFFMLKHLRHIDLSINELDQISSMLFYKNTDLNVIRLNDNPRLSRLPTDGFRSHNGIFTIYYLDISNCAIGALGRKTFSTMPHLATLKLAWNNINNLERDTFTTLYKLNDLDLSNNLILKLDDTIFMNNNDLMKLNLAGNPIQKLPLHLFRPFNNLRELDVSDCELQSLIINDNIYNHYPYNDNYNIYDHYKFYNTLKIFNVSANQIQKITAEDIKPFKNLRSLDISNNPLKCNEGFQQFIAYVSLNNHLQPYKIPTMEPLLSQLFDKNDSTKNNYMKRQIMKIDNNNDLNGEIGWSALAHEVCKHQDPSWIYKYNNYINNKNDNKMHIDNKKKLLLFKYNNNNNLNDMDNMDYNDSDDEDNVNEFKNHKILLDRNANNKTERKRYQNFNELHFINDEKEIINNDNDNYNYNDDGSDSDDDSDDDDDGENIPEHTDVDNFNQANNKISNNYTNNNNANDNGDKLNQNRNENVNDDNIDIDIDQYDNDSDNNDDYIDYIKKAKVQKKLKDQNKNIVDSDILKDIRQDELLHKFLYENNNNNKKNNKNHRNNGNNNLLHASEHLNNLNNTASNANTENNNNEREPKEHKTQHARVYYKSYRFIILLIIIVTSVLLLLLIASKLTFMLMHKRGERYRMSLLQAHKNSIVYQRLSEDIKPAQDNKLLNYHYNNNTNNNNYNNNSNNNKQPKIHQYSPISQV